MKVRQGSILLGLGIIKVNLWVGKRLLGIRRICLNGSCLLGIKRRDLRIMARRSVKEIHMKFCIAYC
ncbi:MAG: hypothetical protein ACJAXZ_001667 [Akkermansiaceae bacterium]|jgi:hypothetical protein